MDPEILLMNFFFKSIHQPRLWQILESPHRGRNRVLLPVAGHNPSCSPRDSFGLENQNVMDPGTQNRSLPWGTNLSEMYDSISPFQKALEINASSQAKSDGKSSVGGKGASI